MRYEVLVGYSIDALVRRVDNKIKMGWVVQGGISHTPEGLGRLERYYQAMTKEED